MDVNMAWGSSFHCRMGDVTCRHSLFIVACQGQQPGQERGKEWGEERGLSESETV